MAATYLSRDRLKVTNIGFLETFDFIGIEYFDVISCSVKTLNYTLVPIVEATVVDFSLIFLWQCLLKGTDLLQENTPAVDDLACYNSNKPTKWDNCQLPITFSKKQPTG